MKRLFVILALLCLMVGFSTNADALYGLNHYQIQLQDQRGLIGEEITDEPTIDVYTVDTTTNVTIYASESATCMDNNYSVGDDGLIDFWCGSSTVDIRVTGDTYQYTFEDVATTDHVKIVSIDAISDTSLTVTEGTNVASASVLTLGTGTLFTITGTTAVQYIHPNDSWAGRIVVLKFGGSVTVHNAEGASTTARVPLMLAHTGGDITATIGDTLMLISDGCVWYQITNND